ncbi:spore coat protein, U domain protein [Bacteriovorax sp. BSW11_IV]|uniref:spore coat protein U domain-containing protein n=1 Tax=Bacteriovorax sp. BSW11_IV TaxID=1353529 RepID=UPI00038A3624|nr:spore coat protein U domain-containing protein [Bacteriovorax sp. BSW11_IV]EQC42992.1 spore coat protein, U domain protein [Bacteriovorax sp. BSW11_IV]
MKWTLIALSLTTNAFAANCDYSFSLSNISIDWSKKDSIVPVNINVNQGSVRNCNRYFLTFSKGTANSYDRKMSNTYSGHLLYNIYSDSSATKVLKDKSDIINSNDYLANSFKHGYATSTFHTKLLVPTDTNAPLIRGGLYQDTVVVSLYDKRPSQSHTLQGQKTFVVQTYVPKIVDISLVDVGAPFDINDTSQTLDFGELETGEERSFDLRVQANAGYAIFFDSQNKGKMVNASGDKVNYTLTVDSATKSLTNANSNAASGTGVTVPGGKAHRVTVKIGNVNGQKYGQYADYITVTAMTTE